MNKEKTMKDLLYAKEIYEITGAAMEVQNELGIGFQEPVYQEALAIELKNRGVPFEREKELTITYKGIQLEKKYYADFVCYGKIIVELKAVEEINNEHVAQVLNYLHATNIKLGYIINFGQKPLQRKRIVL
jgi:GxxExxY protein